MALADPTTPGGPIPTCPTRALLGFTCPGCGSARMVYSLVHGDLPAAIRYNALGVVALLLVAWTVVALALWHYRGKRIARWEHWRHMPVTVGVVMLLWMIIRNLPWEPFTALAV